MSHRVMNSDRIAYHGWHVLKPETTKGNDRNEATETTETSETTKTKNTCDKYDTIRPKQIGKEK